ncbi:MAG: carbamate kinase [Gemmatimonadota bacterium]
MTPEADAASVVVAIGGNALSPAGESASISNQFRHARQSLAPIVGLAIDGWRIVVVHGNGPQVGDGLLRNEVARSAVEELPLGLLVASTAGWIGYMIQQSLQNALHRAGVDRRVITLITQTLIDPEHAASKRAEKAIGHALNDEMAASLRAKGVVVQTDSRGHLRRTVTSPLPIAVLEADVVAELAAKGDIVIAAGGGGPPVYRHRQLGLEGLDAVVDKDRVAAVLATTIGAQDLLILTDVDGVYRAWGQPDAERLDHLTAAEAESLLASGDLAAGSMGPKVDAAISFVRGGGSRAIIARLEEGQEALDGRSGTCIVAD